MPLQSNWVRVTVYLPVNSRLHVGAAHLIVDRINQLFKGSTRSALQPAVFVGAWWNRAIQNIIYENVSMVSVDVPADIDDMAFVMRLEQLLKDVRGDYASVSVPQDEIWMTVHPIRKVVLPP